MRGRGLHGYNEKHPHLRGEDNTGDFNGTAHLETPPPAWGRLIQEQDETGAWRNTPTCVGKTSPSMWCGVSGRKHPHLRGEDLENTFNHNEETETPPPAWGRPI